MRLSIAKLLVLLLSPLFPTVTGFPHERLASSRFTLHSPSSAGGSNSRYGINGLARYPTKPGSAIKGTNRTIKMNLDDKDRNLKKSWTTAKPTNSPTRYPSQSPTTKAPQISATTKPTRMTATPTHSPTRYPSQSPTTKAPQISATTKPTHEFAAQCCSMNTGFCLENDNHTFEIPLLQLSQNSSKRPSIDGQITSQEYASYLELPMFNGGKNGKYGSPLEQSSRIGTAFLAYDCNSNIVCVAAFLDESFLVANTNIQVKQDDSESWIRFGPNDGETKLKESNADVFEYVSKPSDSNFIIGYEGCWNIDLEDPKMQIIANNFVEVHFTRGRGDTTSTGKPASNGKYICLNPGCKPETHFPTFAPSSSPIYTFVNPPSQNPTVSPVQTVTATTTTTTMTTTTTTANKATNVPSALPSLNPTSFPSASPSSSPSSMPSATPSTSPSDSPEESPSSSPSESPSSQPSPHPSSTPSESPSIQPTLSPTKSPTIVVTNRVPIMDPCLLGDVPAANITVYLYGGPTVLSTVTDVNGFYWFESLPPGRYAVYVDYPTCPPSLYPTLSPTKQPSNHSSKSPTSSPTANSFSRPSSSISQTPSRSPSTSPTGTPSIFFSRPSSTISLGPSSTPSIVPSTTPSTAAISRPSSSITSSPTSSPSSTPTALFSRPSSSVTQTPSVAPSTSPSTVFLRPSSSLTQNPSSSLLPSLRPSSLFSRPSSSITNSPSTTPSSSPSSRPSSTPSSSPTSTPSRSPTSSPSSSPSLRPSFTPSSSPTSTPSRSPTSSPSLDPSASPSVGPSASPSLRPTSSPSASPSKIPTMVYTGRISITDGWCVSGDTPLANITVYLYGGPTVLSTVTDSEGFYVFENVTPGPRYSTYVVEPLCPPTPSPSITQSTTRALLLVSDSLTKPGAQVYRKKGDACEAIPHEDKPVSNLVFDSLEECCANTLWFDMDGCVSRSQSEQQVVFPRFYPTWIRGELCNSKEVFDDWEDSYLTLQQCCESHFSWDMLACCASSNMGGC